HPGAGSPPQPPPPPLDGVAPGARGMIVLFATRRMAAITGLQEAQYNHEFRTTDHVPVDYVRLASAVKGVKAVFAGHDADGLKKALAEARAHDGLSLVHVPVYAGEDPLGGMGAYGSWNVGNWVGDVQARYLKQNI
ncbi:MAG: thiamine pyrophosphate-dependent enzyme, partial [Flavobacteriaceae bacterium]